MVSMLLQNKRKWGEKKIDKFESSEHVKKKNREYVGEKRKIYQLTRDFQLRLYGMVSKAQNKLETIYKCNSDTKWKQFKVTPDSSSVCKRSLCVEH